MQKLHFTQSKTGRIRIEDRFGNLYRDLIDKARLKLTAHVRRVGKTVDDKWYAVKPDLRVGGASEELFVAMNVTNVGRRPIQWTGWGGKYRRPINGKKTFIIIPMWLPRMLNEGESHSEFTNELRPADENVKRLCISDASGKNWYLSWWAMKKLKQESRKFQPLRP